MAGRFCSALTKPSARSSAKSRSSSTSSVKKKPLATAKAEFGFVAKNASWSGHATAYQNAADRISHCQPVCSADPSGSSAMETPPARP